MQSLLINYITGKLPKISFYKDCLNIPTTFNLADIAIIESCDIDILIGTEGTPRNIWE